VCQSSSLIPED
jgi:hypothetical protein